MTSPKLLSSSGSQHSRRVRMLVHELDIDVENDLEIEEVPYGPQGFGGTEREKFLAVNPNGKVPVLVLPEGVIWESNAIMWYLAERDGYGPLWPADPVERASISMWQVWQAAHLTPAADGLFFENFVKPSFMKLEPDAKQVETYTASFHRWMKVMESSLERHADPYLALGRFTCADIAVACALSYAEQSSMPVADHPRVAAWLETVRARDSWKQTMPGGPS